MKYRTLKRLKAARQIRERRLKFIKTMNYIIITLILIIIYVGITNG